MQTQPTMCRFAYKYVKGQRVTDKRHRCERACSWSDADVLAALRARDEREGRVQVEHVPCTCGQSAYAHIRERSREGYTGGVGYAKLSDKCPRFLLWPTRHLRTCDCLHCVTSRVTRDLAPVA